MKNAKTITLALRAEDAEPYLREAAETAAKYGAWVDHLTRRTGNLPCRWDQIEDSRKKWQQKFLAAKRIVEAFGVDYEPTSEPETMTVDHPYVGGKVSTIGNIPSFGPVRIRSGSKPDYKRPFPSYRGGIHAEACRQAAERVVKAWRAGLEDKAAA